MEQAHAEIRDIAYYIKRGHYDANYNWNLDIYGISDAGGIFTESTHFMQAYAAMKGVGSSPRYVGSLGKYSEGDLMLNLLQGNAVVRHCAGVTLPAGHDNAAIEELLNIGINWLSNSDSGHSTAITGFKYSSELGKIIYIVNDSSNGELLLTYDELCKETRNNNNGYWLWYPSSVEVSPYSKTSIWIY